MKKKDYLYAVASVRAMENSLLKSSDMEQLINAPDYEKAVMILSEKGYETPVGSDYSAVLDKELEKTWDLVRTSAPEASSLRLFIVKNDFQNLKAILKSEVMEYRAEDYFVRPSVTDPKELLSAVSERDFDRLPDYLSAAAKEAFEVLTKTGSGQLCDAMIDTAALETIIRFANESEDPLLKEYAQTLVFVSDIKTAYRAVKTKKNAAFVKAAIAENDRVNRDSLIAAVLGGEDEFSEYLSSNGMVPYKEALEESGSAFEKYCDDQLLSIMKKAKMTAFGVSPIAAYFTAKETEIKCLRIILSAKLSAVSNEIIRERMRELYV